MGRWTGLVTGLVLLGAGCAQGGSGPGPGTGGGPDAGTPLPRDAAAPPDRSISTRPDTGPVRFDAGTTGCPEICALPNATSSCVGDRCVIDACDPGYDDCDGEAENGCEASLDSVDHCGTCGNACSVPNATPTCTGGTCGLGECNSGYGDCNDEETDGCETALDSESHCGACGNACAPGASCVGGSCSGMSCPAGSSDCDGDGTTGCEVDHTSATNDCASAENLGSASGDVACGFLCGSASWVTLATRTGNTGAWFRARALECSFCPADVYHCFTLEVPAGVDYDLLAYSACGSLIGSVPAGPGETEEFCVSRADGFSGDDDSFDYWLEVRHRSGASCFDWRLTVESTSCGC